MATATLLEKYLGLNYGTNPRRAPRKSLKRFNLVHILHRGGSCRRYHLPWPRLISSRLQRQLQRLTCSPAVQ